MSSGSVRIVRKALGGGRWFPGQKQALQQMVDQFMDAAKVAPIPGRVVSAITPHAGFVYSGPVAGFTFRALRDSAAAGHEPETVVVLGFAHRSGFRGVALMDGDAVETPLGEIALDRDAAALLALNRPRLFPDYAPHAGEHSAENEIPFIQRALPRSKLVVALIGDHDPATLRELTAGLAELAQAGTICVVASSDMLHDPDYDIVSRTDRQTLKKVEAMDHAGLLQEWGPRRQTFCGIATVVTAMRFAEGLGCRKATVLHYRNSGDDHPESRGEWVVGYGAVAFAAVGAP